MNKFKWYAVHTLSQSEQKVKTLIENTKQKFDVADYIGEIIIPMDIEVKKTNGKTIEKQTKVLMSIHDKLENDKQEKKKSIKKPTKELLFSKLNKNVISGPNYQFCGSEEKANQKHQNYDSSL